MPCAAQWLEYGGARAAGMGLAVTGVNKEVWGLAGNPASVSGLTQVTAGLAVEQHFLLSELNKFNFVVAVPYHQSQIFGLALSSFGFADYHESTAGLAYAATLHRKYTLATEFRVLNIAIPGYGSAYSLLVDAGVHAELLPNLSVGVAYKNGNRARIGDAGIRKLPSLLALGLAYGASNQVMLTLDVAADFDLPASIRAGLEYRPTDAFSMRLGVNKEPAALFFGFGYRWQSLSVDLASRYQPDLGTTPTLSLNYVFGHAQ